MTTPIFRSLLHLPSMPTGPQPVTWQGFTYSAAVDSSGNLLTTTDIDQAWIPGQGASTVEQVTGIGGYVQTEVQVIETGTTRYLGLTNNPSVHRYSGMAYCLQVRGGDSKYALFKEGVYEGNLYSPQTAGDIVALLTTAGGCDFILNGVVIASFSSAVGSFPYYVDAWLPYGNTHFTGTVILASG